MRRIGFVVAVMTLIAVLASCVGTRSGGDGGGGVAAVKTAAPAKSTKGDLTIWSYVQQKGTPWITRAIDEFKADYPNVKIRWTFVPYMNMASKLLGTAVSGGSPDGIFYNPSDAAEVAQSGLLADMTPFWNAYPDKAQFPKSVVWRDGRKVISVQGYINTTALWYNKTILDKLGLKPPRTVAQLTEQFKKIKAAGYGGLTMCARPTAESEFQIFPWMLGAGLNYGQWNQSKLTSVLGRFASWIKAEYIPKDVTGWTGGDALSKFQSGKFAFSQNGNWNLAKAETSLKFKWGVVPLPAGSAGSHSVGGGEGFSIGAKAKNSALVWQFFKQALLTKKAETGILKDTGSIPARSDLANDPTLSSNPKLKVYTTVVKNMGTRPSNPKISEYLIDMGKVWNGLAGGQTTPQQAARQIIAQMSKM